MAIIQKQGDLILLIKKIQKQSYISAAHALEVVWFAISSH